MATTAMTSVPTGFPVLDKMLGGGIRLVSRAVGTPSTGTVLIRGSTGTGKTLLASSIALAAAGALERDVLYHCTEHLPSEIIAQRAGFACFDARQAVNITQDPSDPRDPTSFTGPFLVVDLLDVIDDQKPLSDEMMRSLRLAVEKSYRPGVVVLDAFTREAARKMVRREADGICKLAAQQGWLLVIVEEAPLESGNESQLAYAADVVVVTQPPRFHGNDVDLYVTKNRFGPRNDGCCKVHISQQCGLILDAP